MPEILDDIAYLSQEIGPRPAGSEEEQQAAFYIADQFKKRVGIKPQTEEFSCISCSGVMNFNEFVDVILFGLPIIMSILAMIHNMFVLPAILVSLICAVLFVLEVMGKPLLSKAFQRGLSQNVVAKYRPEGLRNKRSRKVIVVAHYDSGKVRSELSLGPTLGILQKVSAAALLAIPIIWIIRAIAALGATGTALIVWNVITIIVMVLALFPIVLFFVHNAAQYNEGANSNASGVAALLELADRIRNTPPDIDFDAEIHGEEAAIEAGLIPEGAEVEYEAPANVEPEMTEAERLMAAKAAVAALTGKPVRGYTPAETAEEAEALAADTAAQSAQEGDSAPREVVAEQKETADQSSEAEACTTEQAHESEVAVDTVGTPIPDWYKEAQEKADKSRWDETPVRRSYYASALDEAVASSTAFFDAANRAMAQEEAALEERYPSSITEVPAQETEQVEELSEPAQEPQVQLEEEQAAIDGEPLPQPVEEVVADSADEQVQEPIADAAEEPAQEPVAEVAEEPVQEPPLAADFMVQKPVSRVVDENETTAPIPAVGQPAIESVMVDDEFMPGATRAMAPIDVSELRASLGNTGANQAVRDLQNRPSLNVEPAPRRDVDRVVMDGDSGQILDLPELESPLPPVPSVQKQRAPLADNSNPSLSSKIPRINLDAFGVSTSGNAEPLDNKRAALRSMLPSMSGSITLEGDSKPEQKGTVSLTGSFAPISATGSVGRVGDELVEGVAPDELYIQDADDSFSETTMTETGAYAGPGYVEMPESRVSRFFGRFRKKDANKESRKNEGTAQEWLGVEDDFNPRQAGAARGGWESFANNDEGRKLSDRRNDADAFDDDWNGGAFSKDRSTMPGEAYEKEQDALPNEMREPSAHTSRNARAEAYDIQAEIDQVEGFYAKKMEVEVWFVALGSELAGNAGMKAFLAEHAGELRGSVIINLDSLGAGTFSYIDKEGYLTDKSVSARVRRYLKKAEQGSGVHIIPGTIQWRDSAASAAMKRGVQAITLAGMEGPKPAFMGQGDDVLENIDEYTIYDRVDFVETLVRSV